jgi:NADPH-dependent 2,4-dienoyl-CoA reductase/sulfur reductase-like enzyme
VVSWSPSAERDPVSGSTPHAMTLAEVSEIVAAFVETAERLKRAGFDGVELHGAHGYLITQFLSPWSNRRDDAYGGPIEHRIRFVREIIDGVRETCGPEFVVGLKLSIHEYVSGGLTLEDSREILEHLNRSSPPDYVGVSQGNFTGSLERHVPDMRFDPAPFLGLAEGIRGAAGTVPIVFMGRVVGPSHAESILASGAVDLIGMARPLIADADLARKALAGQPERIRPCIFCNTCWGEIHAMRPVACIHGPETGREAEEPEDALPPPAPRRVVRIIGAGPAGLEAARVASRRGHDVHVYEARARAGGQASPDAVVPGREDFGKIADYLVQEAARAGARIHLAHPVGVEAAAQWIAGGDAVIAATGAEPDPPAVPGARAVYTLESALARGDWAGMGVVVLDEIEDEPVYAAAEALAARGAAVQLVTRRLQIGRRLAFVSLIGTLRRLAEADIPILTCRVPVRMEGQTLVTRHAFSGREDALERVDALVCCGPYRARDAVARELLGRGLPVRLIGDAYAPRRMAVAVFEGHEAGRTV